MKTLLVLSSIVITGGATAFWMAGALPAPTDANLSAAVTSNDATSIVRAIGYIEPASEIRKLTFKSDGVVATCNVRVGQQVKGGETLATLRSRGEEAAVAVAEQELAVAQAEREKLLSGIHPRQIEAAERRVSRVREKQRHAQQQYDRQARLYERKVATEEALDQVRTDLHQAKEELEEAIADLNELKTHVRDADRTLADARVKLADAHVVAAKERLQDTILQAPLGGTVLEILKREGENVQASDSQPAIIFADLSHVRVRAEVDERFVDVLSAGQEVVIYGRGLGQRRIPGKLVLMKPLMGNKTVFSRDSGERKDLDVIQVFIEPTEPLRAPIGLQVDVDVIVPVVRNSESKAWE